MMIKGQSLALLCLGYTVIQGVRGKEGTGLPIGKGPRICHSSGNISWVRTMLASRDSSKTRIFIFGVDARRERKVAQSD